MNREMKDALDAFNEEKKLKEDVKKKLHRYEIILEEYINSLNNKQK